MGWSGTAWRGIPGIHHCLFVIITILLILWVVSQVCSIRESVDSLCRDGKDGQYTCNTEAKAV